MTAAEKLDEAKFFLGQLMAVHGHSQEFIYFVSAFLSAARSALDHLLHDYATVEGLRLERVGLNSFRAAARRGSGAAREFASWFEENLARLGQDPTHGFLLSMRHASVHQRAPAPRSFRLEASFGPIPPGGFAAVNLGDVIWKATSEAETIVRSSAGEVIETGKTHVRVTPFFEQNKLVPAAEICVRFYDAIISIVFEGRTKFPPTRPADS